MDVIREHLEDLQGASHGISDITRLTLESQSDPVLYDRFKRLHAELGRHVARVSYLYKLLTLELV